MTTGRIVDFGKSAFLMHILLVISSVKCQMTNIHFSMITFARPHPQTIVSSNETSTVLSCAIQCVSESRHQRCTVATYNKTSRNCTFTTSSMGSFVYSSLNDTVTLFPKKGCDPKDLPHVDNGQYKGSPLVSEWLYIECYTGYHLSLTNDINTVMCDVDGVWLQNNVTCLPREETAYVEGRKFTTAFMPNYEMTNDSLHLYIIPSDVASTTQYSTVTVKAPYVSFSKTIALTELVKVEIPIGVINETTDIGIPNAVSVEADKPVTVFAMNSSPYSSGGMLVLPEQSLSTTYLVTSTPYEDARSRLVIIPMHEDAEVTVTFPDRTNITTAIKAGDTYQIKKAGLSGTIVESDKDIAVLAGEWCANLPDPGNYSCDHIVEQMPPLEALDTQYIIAQFEPRSTFVLSIVTATDNTTVTLSNANGMGIYVGELNRGETLSTTFDNVPYMSVTANNPILVTQYGVSASVDNAPYGDSSMFVVPGVNHFMTKYRFMVPEGYDINMVIIIYNITSDEVGSARDPRNGLLHNGRLVYIAKINEVQVGDNKFGICYLYVSNGVHQIENSVKFGAVLYGQKRYNEYAWNLGMYMRGG